MKIIYSFGAAIMVIALILIFSSFKKLKVRTRGTIVKAQLIQKGEYITKGGSYCDFIWGSQTFSVKLGRDTYAAAKIDDTFEFYHLDSEPRLFIEAGNRIEGLYFDICVGIVLSLFGVYFIVYFLRQGRIVAR